MLDKYLWTSRSSRRNDLTKVYEPVQPLLFGRLGDLVKDAVFIDVGANIGAYTILMACHQNVRQVIAFEPQPDCIDELRDNIRLNHLEAKVIVRPLALSNEAGKARFRRCGPLAGNSGLEFTIEESHAAAWQHIDVDTDTLDNTCRIRGRNILMKIDVEGHEKFVLEGGCGLLTENRGFLQIEIHPTSPLRVETEQVLSRSGWTKMFSVHWDHYFTNTDGLLDASALAELFGRALTDLVMDGVTRRVPWRRRIVGGLVIEMPRDPLRVFKRLLRARRGVRP